MQKKDGKKEKIFTKILKIVYELNEYVFYSEEEIYDFNNYDI